MKGLSIYVTDKHKMGTKYNELYLTTWRGGHCLESTQSGWIFFITLDGGRKNSKGL